MMMAASVARGSQASQSVNHRLASRMPMAVKAPASGVAAPASKLTTERDSPPEIGMPPLTPAPMLESPSAISSLSGSMR